MHPNFYFFKTSGHSILLVCFFVMMLVGCNITVPYQKIDAKAGRHFGYQENLINPGQYVLLVVNNNAQNTRKMWHRRANDLCGHTNYTYNIFRADQKTAYYGYYGGQPGHFEYEGKLICGDVE